MVGVAVQLLGELRIDLDFDRSFGSDFALDFGDNFRRCPVEAWPPDGNRTPAADPVVKSLVPGIVVSEPPVAWAVTPVPERDGIPRVGVAAAEDLVFDGRFGNR